MLLDSTAMRLRGIGRIGVRTTITGTTINKEITMSTANVKVAMDNLEKCMNENSKYGVWDSEPVYVMRRILRNTVKGLPVKVPSTSRDWQIYDMEGSESVAQNLHNVMQDVVKEVGSTTVFESNTEEFKSLFYWIMY
jgi:hypothetical protein